MIEKLYKGNCLFWRRSVTIWMSPMPTSWFFFKGHIGVCWFAFFSDLQQEEVEADDSDVPEWESPYFVGESTTPSNQGRKRGSYKKVCLLHSLLQMIQDWFPSFCKVNVIYFNKPSSFFCVIIFWPTARKSITYQYSINCICNLYWFKPYICVYVVYLY